MYDVCGTRYEVCLNLPSTLDVEGGQVKSNSVSDLKQPLGQLGVHRLAKGGILSNNLARGAF